MFETIILNASSSRDDDEVSAVDVVVKILSVRRLKTSFLIKNMLMRESDENYAANSAVMNSLLESEVKNIY